MSKAKETEKYEFESLNPIKGYPELYWRGKRPFTSTQYYPAQLKERYGEEDDSGWINKIFWGDNLQIMSHLLKDFRGKIKLIYIDPPFDSKADYKKKITLRKKTIMNDNNSFEEKQYEDIWMNDEYLQFIYERLIILRELLSDDGAIYVHCDYHKSSYIKIIMDNIFGIDNFRNEIIWCYKTSLKSSQNSFGRDHDTILFYSKTSNHSIHPDKGDFPSSESTIKRWGKYADKNGFVSNKYFAGSNSTIINTEDECKGFNIYNGIPRDWWEISANVSKGNTDEVIAGKYPTQKPEELIKRIIKSSSDPGDIVLDCFMGSGTTQAVSIKLDRRFIGADINLGAIQTSTKRLLNILKTNKEQRKYCGFEVYNVNNYDIFRNPAEAKEILIEALGIQTLGRDYIYDGELDGKMVKIMPINRITTRADLGELISGLPYKIFQKREEEHPNSPVESIILVCMGHEPDLKAYLQSQVDYKLDIEIVDILRDKSEIQFKRESEAEIIIDNKKLIINKFYPKNLLQKMSLLDDEDIEDWRELVESIVIDFNYDGVVIEPYVMDIPDRNELVKGEYEIPEDAGVIKVKITDVLSETFEWEGAYEYVEES